ncbi:MAG: BTAD domain-containing putative transcriptional regulator, partial [Stackebrandtia sp.]
MLVRLLGPVEVSDAEGGWVRAGAPKQCCVLAALALAPGRALSNEALADRLWSGSPPDSARGVVYGHVTRLRGLLEGRHDVKLARARSDGYRLDMPAEQIDVFHMRRLVSRARATAEAGEHRQAVELWREAERLWRGPALSGLSGLWVERTRSQLEREHLGVLTGRFEAELTLGRHVEIVAELEELAARHPLSETLAAQLMLALYRCDRISDALSRYTDARNRLRDELGNEPGEQLRVLHRQILRQDPQLSPAREAEPPDDAPPAPRQLPADVATFTGRRDQVAALVEATKSGDAAADVVVVSAVDGMGGVGKTALAVHAAALVADDFPDGQLFVDLRGFSPESPPLDPSEALDRMLRGLGVPGRQIPDDPDSRSAALRTALSGKRVLVVLDNAADEDQVRPLLPGLSECAVIVTSRRRLAGLDDARLLSLDVLSPGEAVDLFDRVYR